MSQTLAPDALLVQTNLTGSVTDIDESVDSPDANWLTASGNPTLRCSFGTPTTAPDAKDQAFRLWLRNDGNTDETETLRPIAGEAFVLNNLTGTYADVDDDPDSPDGNWLLNIDNGSATTARIGFPTPAASLKTGSGLQELRVLLRKDATGGNDVAYTVHVYEGNSPLTTPVNTSGTLTDAGGDTIVSLTFDASGLADQTGADLQVYIEETSGHTGGPSNRRFIEIGAVEANVSSLGYTKADIEVWESGSKVATIPTQTVSVTSTTGELVEVFWDSAELATASGANVELYLTQSAGTQNLLEIGAVEWVCYQGSQFQIFAGNSTDGVSVIWTSPGKRGRLPTRATLGWGTLGSLFDVPPALLPSSTEDLRLGFGATQGDGGAQLATIYSVGILIAPNATSFVSPDADVPVSGLSGTGSVGSVTVQIAQDKTVTVSGVSATGSVGSPGIGAKPQIGTKLGYFDANVAGPADAQSVWTNDANAFDGSDSTYAESTSWSVSATTEYLSGTGVNLPVDMSTWTSPVWQFRSKVQWDLSDNKLTVYHFIYSAVTNVGSTQFRWNTSELVGSVYLPLIDGWNRWRSPWTDPGPAGWTASEILNLELRWKTAAYAGAATVNYFRPYKTEIRVQDGSITECTGWVGSVVVSIPGSVTVTGVSGAGSVSAVSITGDANVTLNGLSATATPGSVSLSGKCTIGVTGVSATGAVGTVIVDTSTAVDVPVTGVSATGQVGSVTLSGKASYNVSGLGATSPPGTVTITADCNVSVSGLAATAAPGSVTTLAACDVSISGLEATGSSDSVTLSGQATVSLTGLAATGSVTAVTPAVAPTLVGVSATGAVGTVIVQTYAPRFVLSDSTHIAASGENTTAQLLAPAGKTTGDFGGGRIQDDENPTDSVDIALNQYREDEWCIQATAEVLTSEVYEFRVLIDGQPADTISVTPQWTIVVAGPVTVPVTGVQATAAVGSVTVATSITVPVSGLAATSSVGTVTVDGQVTVTVTGLQATASSGSVTSTAAAQVAVTGLTATAQNGSVTVTGDANVSVTGLEATGASGSATVTSAETVLVTGLQAAGAPGTVTVTGDANVPVSGLEATGTPGSVTVTSPETVFVTGLQATAAVGTVTTAVTTTVPVTGLEATASVESVTLTGTANIALTGLQATGQVGTVTVQAAGSVTVPLTGLQATASTGSVTVSAQQTATVPVTGTQASGTPGSVTVTGLGNAAVSGLQATAQVGSVSVATGTTVPVTGSTATAALGTVTTSGAANIALTGVQGSGQVGTVTINAVGLRFVLSDSTHITASGENTTAQLTPPSGKTTGDFGGGRIQDDENPTDSVDIGTSQYREDEWCIQATQYVIATEQYEFRVLIDGQPADTISVTPRWTIASTGAVTVPVSGLAATAAVGSVTVSAQRFVDVPVSGLQATGASGAVTVAITADVPVSGLSGAATGGSVAVTGDANVLTTGLEATGQIGSVTVTSQATVALNGLAASGEVDSVTVSGDCNVTLSGVQATASRGSVVVQTAGNITVPVSGLQATGQVGSVTLSTATTVVETGQVATIAIGSVTVTADANVSPTGVAATAESGAVSVTAVNAPTIPVSGVAATGAVGTVIVQTGAGVIVPVTGFSLVGQPGSPSTFGDANIAVTGTSSSAQVGTATVSGAANVLATGLEATAGSGSVTITTGENVPVNGLAATGEVGSVTVTGLATVTPSGVEGNGQVGTVTVSAALTVTVTGVAANGESGTVSITSGPRIAVTGVAAIGSVGSVALTGTAHVYPDGVEATGEIGNVLQGFDYIQAELFLDSPIVYEINLDSLIVQNLQMNSEMIYQIGVNSPIVVKINLKSQAQDVDMESHIANYD